MRNRQKKIAVVNDFCGFGRCSLSVSLPILSALKVQCCPLPTALFSNHTGFDSFYRTDFTNHMEAYIDEWKKLRLHFNGLLVGFLGDPAQIGIVTRFIKHFKAPDTVTVIDPVMGDYGKLYPSYPPQLAEQLGTLLPLADILTPNLTEACLLTGTAYCAEPDAEFLETLCRRLNRMGPKKIVISGVERSGDLENYIFEEGTPSRITREHRVGPCRSGTGDVFSSIVAADAVNGISFAESVQHASSFIAKVLRQTVAWQVPATDGICFEEFLNEI